MYRRILRERTAEPRNKRSRANLLNRSDLNMTKTIRRTVSKPAQARISDRTGPRGKSGLVPVGDVRLTANIRADLHMKLRIRAVEERTTVGELVERWIESWK